MDDTRFWNSAERIEGDFTGDGDVPRFRRRMKRLGFDEQVIRERVDAIHPELLDQLP